jgi:DNA-binding IclR family transcriptional regulator
LARSTGQRSITALNRSLVRGIEVLKAFRQGVDLLGNGDIAERTGLSKATVSRLTQTLVCCGMLERDAAARAYRLAAPVLCMAHAMRLGSPILKVAAPKMRALAEKRRVNVGLAAPDRDAMVYLESFRFNAKVSLRTVVAGQRVPVELTSLGRAYLSTLASSERRRVLESAKCLRPGAWSTVSRDIDAAMEMLALQDYCWACWQPGVVALATPLLTSADQIYALNISLAAHRAPDRVARELSKSLLALKAAILSEFGER